MKRLLLLGWVLAGAGALAPRLAPADPVTQETLPSDQGNPASPTPQRLMERDSPFGDPGGLRSRLANYGVVFGIFYTGEVFGNPLGGKRQGAVYDGLFEPGLDIDFGKLAGWQGLKFHALAYDPHGPSGTAKYVGDLGYFSNIDAYDSFTLFELWFDQSFFDGKLSIRLGQLAVDSEFANSQGGALFLNAGFGALPTFSLNVPVPIYPIAAPGARVRWQPREAFYAQFGAYDGNPDPNTLGDPSPGFQPGRVHNRHGIRVNLNSKEGAFLIGEAAWRPNHEPNATGLPGAYRIGGFYHTDTFSDLRLASDGRSLADPASSGIARARKGDYGVYFTFDQTVYQSAPPPPPPAAASSQNGGKASPPPPPAAPDQRTLSLFARGGYAPDDRNRVPWFFSGGLNWKGPLASRAKDVLGLGFTYTGLSGTGRRLDRDMARFQQLSQTPRDYEVVLELTYQFNLSPWLQLQPDLQGIFHPGGSSAVDDALVLGVRNVLTF